MQDIIRRLLCLMILLLVVTPATAVNITPEKQLISPGKNYTFTVEGAELTNVKIIDNSSKTKVDWKTTVNKNAITVKVPEDAKFSEYLLKVGTSGGKAVAKMVIKPQTGILLTVFAVPLFLSAGMIAGGSYIFVKKKGIFRFAGIGVAIIGALLLFGVVMILVVFNMV